MLRFPEFSSAARISGGGQSECAPDRWKLEPLKCMGLPLGVIPFSPVHNARKFSAVQGTQTQGTQSSGTTSARELLRHPIVATPSDSSRVYHPATLSALHPTVALCLSLLCACALVF